MAESLDEIERLSDWDSIDRHADERAVNLDGCESIQQMKDRLRYDWMKRNGHMKDRTVAEKLMREIHDQDEKRRRELSDLYTEIGEVLHDSMGDKRLRTQLETEGVTTAVGYKSTIQKFQESLGHEHCAIVLAGETSSGKSSLLNLFMEEDVLPSKLLSCTSAVCELLYGNPAAGQLIPSSRGGAVAGQPFPFEERHQYIYKQTDRSDVMDHIVRLWVPLPFLKSGVTLVDTPGIGENNEMKQVLLDYVERNQIYGFIYVIKTDNAGGVAKDRLQQLLSHLTMLKSEFGQLKVDPKTAIFICNRWDMVPDEQKQDVEQDVIKKLKLCWPGFDPNRQLFKMNTEFAINTLKAGYITDDYAALIDGIQELLPMGLQRKLKMAYWWLDNVLRRLRHPIQVYLNRARQTDAQMKGKKSQVEKRVANIQKECDAFMQNFGEQIKGKIELISRELLEYIKTEDALKAVKKWRRDDLPVEEYGDSWPIVEDNINTAVDSRISKVIREWEEQKQIMKSHQRELLQYVSINTQSINEQLEDLEKVIRSTTTIDGDEDSQPKRMAKVGSLDVPTDLEDPSFFIDVMISFDQRVAIQNLADTLSLVPSMLLDRKRTSHRRQSDAENRYKEYKKDRLTHIAGKAAIALESIKKMGVVRVIVEAQLKGIATFVDDVKKQTPRLLKANQELLQTILKDNRKKEDIICNYQPLERKVDDLMEISATFAYGAIKEYEMKDEDVDTKSTNRMSVSPTISTGGIFASYKTGYLKKNGKGKVTIKSYHPAMRNVEKLFEEESIRTMMKKNTDDIPKVLAVMQSANQMPVLVLKGHLQPARQMYFKTQMSQAEGRTRIHHFKACRGLVDSLSKALSWLHAKRLVHMEISLDSVMVDSKGRVKLTNLGEARVLRLQDSELIKPSGSYVYLSPDVLRGECYTSASDVYSLGILIWEVWHDQPIYTEEKKGPLQTFIDLPDTYDTLKQGIRTFEDVLPIISGVVQKCMQAGGQLTMRQFRDLWDSAQEGLDDFFRTHQAGHEDT